MKEDILLSIVISTRDKPWPVLSMTLDSILNSTYRNYEIVLIDQNKNNKIESEMRQNARYKTIVYFRTSEMGLSRGRNLGITHSRGSWFLFFDDDAILPDDTLGKIAPSLIRHQNDPMIFYGRVTRLDTNKPYLRRAFTMGASINLLNFDSVCSIALLFNKKIFDETGPFDENIGAGTRFGAGEESDIILKSLRRKIKITLLDSFTVFHPPPDVHDIKKRMSYGMGIGAVYKKHLFSSPPFFLILGLKFLMELILRSSLIVSALCSAGSKYHSYYLRGLLRGLSSFAPDKNTQDKYT